MTGRGLLADLNIGYGIADHHDAREETKANNNSGKRGTKIYFARNHDYSWKARHGTSPSHAPRRLTLASPVKASISKDMTLSAPEARSRRSNPDEVS